MAVLILAGFGDGVAAPLDLSGNVGYNYRQLVDPDGRDTISNQVRAMLNAHAYLWQPWLATLDSTISATQDATEYDDKSNTTDTTLFTGDVDFKLLPQSSTPFSLGYRYSDSRVDTFSIDDPLIALGQDFTTRRLSLSQALLSKAGHRLKATYDKNEWSSDKSGSIEDELYGLELDLRLPKQRLVTEGTYQKSDQARAARERKRSMFEVDHFYYPTRSLRIDSRANWYRTENNFPLGTFANTGNSDTDLAQVSSFFFWRPVGRPLTVSGGARVFDFNSTASTGATLNNKSYSLSAGAIYQMTKNFRVDGDAAYTALEGNSGGQTDNSRQRLGALFQSDVAPVLGAAYQWFVSASLLNETDDVNTRQSVNGTLSHELQRMWSTGKSSNLRSSISQSLSPNWQSDGGDQQYRLEHSWNSAWLQSGALGSTQVQLILSDLRDLGDRNDNQQLANFQFLRTQNLTRRSTLSGNLTIQVVNQHYELLPDSSVTTGTARIDYRHMALFGVPRLRFLSDFYWSRAGTSDSLDRGEWENRLDYSLGLLEMMASMRFIDNDADIYELWYFQVTRSF